MKKIIIALFGCIFLTALNAQQDAQYSLYQFNQMAINPAYAGSRDAIAMVLDIRNQWVSFPGAPTTLGFSIHAPALNNKVGVGLTTFSDKIGAKSVTGAYGNFAYIIKLKNNCKLSFGLRAGYLNYRFNFNKVNYKDANETTLINLSNTNKGVVDVDAGLFLKTNTFFAGLSATHLTQAKIYMQNYETKNGSTNVTSNFTSSYVLSSHMFFVMGKAFAFSENFIFSPSIMVKSVPGSAMADLNFNFFMRQRVWFGVFFKQEYGAGVLLQVYATEKLRVGYSYDSGFGAKRILGSSHEIMLGFDFGTYKSKILSPRFL